MDVFALKTSPICPGATSNARIFPVEVSSTICPLEFSTDLVDRLKVKKKYVVYEAERHAIGGSTAAQMGEHWFSMLADWCLDRIENRPAPHEYVFVNAIGQQQVKPYR